MFTLAAFIFFCGVRGIVFFTIVNIYMLTESLAQRDRTSAPKGENLSRVWDKVVCLLVIALMAVRLSMSVREGHFLVFPNNAPVAAVKYLNDHNVKGRVFNTDTYGGYLIWVGYPHLRPFVDGRQLNQGHYFQYISLLSNPSAYWAAAEQEFNFNIVMLESSDKTHKKLLDYMKGQLSWEAIFDDGHCVVFKKRGTT